MGTCGHAPPALLPPETLQPRTAGCMPISISPRHTSPNVNPALPSSFPLLPRILLWSIQTSGLPNSAPLFLTASLALGNYFNSSLYPPLLSRVMRSQVCHAHCSAWEVLHPFPASHSLPKRHKVAGDNLTSLPSSTRPFSPTATSSVGERDMQPFPLTSLRRPALFPSPCHLLTYKRAGH